jgi:hypothetical protein
MVFNIVENTLSVLNIIDMQLYYVLGKKKNTLSGKYREIQLHIDFGSLGKEPSADSEQIQQHRLAQIPGYTGINQISGFRNNNWCRAN